MKMKMKLYMVGNRYLTRRWFGGKEVDDIIVMSLAVVPVVNRL